MICYSLFRNESFVLNLVRPSICFSYVLIISWDHKTNMANYLIYRPFCSDNFIRFNEIVREMTQRNKFVIFLKYKIPCIFLFTILWNFNSSWNEWMWVFYISKILQFWRVSLDIMLRINLLLKKSVLLLLAGFLSLNQFHKFKASILLPCNTITSSQNVQKGNNPPN